MKILNIKPAFDDMIEIEVEGYPQAQPVFPADTKAEDLPNLLKAWKVNQDEVDAINAQAKLVSKIEPTISEELKALENKEIQMDILLKGGNMKVIGQVVVMVLMASSVFAKDVVIKGIPDEITDKSITEWCS